MFINGTYDSKVIHASNVSVVNEDLSISQYTENNLITISIQKITVKKENTLSEGQARPVPDTQSITTTLK